jgi:hypothetical protein
MSIETETGQITLGGRSFPVSAFTFDQLQRLAPAFARLELGLHEGGVQAAQEIIATALADQIAEGELAQVKTNLVEIFSALPVIARASGLTALGEALAGTATA